MRSNLRQYALNLGLAYLVGCALSFAFPIGIAFYLKGAGPGQFSSAMSTLSIVGIGGSIVLLGGNAVAISLRLSKKISYQYFARVSLPATLILGVSLLAIGNQGVPVACVAVAAACLAFIRINSSHAQVLSQLTWSVVPEKIFRPIAIMFALSALTIIIPEQSRFGPIDDFYLALLLGSLAAAGLSHFELGSTRRKNQQGNPTAPLKLMGLGIGPCLVSTMSACFGGVDIILANHLLGSFDGDAFASCARVAAIILVPQPLLATLYNRRYRTHDKITTDALLAQIAYRHRHLVEGNTVGLAASIAACVAFPIAAKVLPVVPGSTWSVFLILCTARLVETSTTPLCHYAVIAGQATVVFVTQGIGLICVILGAYLGFVYFGLLGGSVGILAGSSLTAALQYWKLGVPELQ